MPLRNSRNDVEREMSRLLDQETFRGGTDITRGLYDAATYMGRSGRRDARRAIVILTDDETQLQRASGRRRILAWRWWGRRRAAGRHHPGATRRLRKSRAGADGRRDASDAFG